MLTIYAPARHCECRFRRRTRVFRTPSGHDRIQLTPENVSAAREGDPNRLRKRLRGDLDSILLMALRKELYLICLEAEAAGSTLSVDDMAACARLYIAAK